VVPFLKREKGCWVKVGHDSARAKVSHFFQQANPAPSSEGDSSDSESSKEKARKRNNNEPTVFQVPTKEKDGDQQSFRHGDEACKDTSSPGVLADHDAC
jgi:hypothetical protein